MRARSILCAIPLVAACAGPPDDPTTGEAIFAADDNACQAVAQSNGATRSDIDRGHAVATYYAHCMTDRGYWGVRH